MKLEYMKLHSAAQVPLRAHRTDAGLDLSIDHDVSIAVRKRYRAGTGIAVAIPEGYVGYVNPRSGISYEQGLTVINAPGTLDPGYRGEVQVALVNLGEHPITLQAGQRVAQLVLHPIATPQLVEVQQFSVDGERGANGFGSTGTQHVASTGERNEH